MAEQDRSPVGSVAEEAARLVDALGEWAQSAGSDRYAESPVAGKDHAAGPRCAHCGAKAGLGRPVVCELCPVCQGIGVLRSIRPETVDRLADLAGAVTTALRDLAARRREPARAGADPGPRHGGRGGGVDDIPIEDEDEGEDERKDVVDVADGNGGHGVGA
ncbi:hypothetical protein [Pedococcus sp. 5OH_020]|uniref:hypothetical protein n=1 Tax=Pedococcus sp. 5OH_020 TaxID=2989814 RepID=UPI0022E9D187|nr:hypothetical protein [Pedococcus sp. 5OH_020]